MLETSCKSAKRNSRSKKVAVLHEFRSSIKDGVESESQANSPIPSKLSGAGPFSLNSELQKRIGQVIFSTLCEHLGIPNLELIDGYNINERLKPNQLQAARALLGWTMSDLAKISSLSISTVKRIEHAPDNVNNLSYLKFVKTLQASGIRFFRLSDGTIALTRISKFHSQYVI